MDETMKCGRCGHEMEEGYLLDINFVRLERISWVQGTPEEGFLGVKIGMRDQYYVTAYRCKECGSLEFFAPSNQPYRHKSL